MPDDPRIETIEIRPQSRQVLVGGQAAPLGARAFDLLMALYERRDRVVTKNELLEVVWPGLVVEENNLQVQVSSLRKVLGPAAIATIPGRGYRFTLPPSVVVERDRLESTRPEPVRAAIDEVPRANLPAATPLYGRDDEVASVRELMRGCPVVSVVGAGGIGKTRLALAAAAADPRPAPDGRWWIELAPINEGMRIPAAIAAALGLQLPGGRPPPDALAALLARHRALLVLDNCEHLAEDVAPLVALLRASAPEVRLLITSQESLKCVDEQVYRLGSLDLPPNTDPEEASRYGAVALFVARAHAVDPRFRLAPDNVAAVIDICRRLDGIPLGIELAAARVPMLGVLGLQARLDQMFNVLTGVARMKLRRHQTLRAALEWSHGLLSEDEQAVFRRLGVFAGGFTLELAQHVASDARIDTWQVLDLLAQLIDKSLVIAEGEGEPRYRLLEPTRAYALEHLASADESVPLLRRHAEAVCAAMDTCEDVQWTEPYGIRLRRLAELGNLRAAVDWAMSPGGDRLLAYRMLGKGWFLWVGNSVSPEGLERMLRLWPIPADLPVDVEAGFCLGLACLRGGFENDAVVKAVRRALELYRQLGDSGRQAHALCRLGVIEVARGNLAAAAQATDEAKLLMGPAAAKRLQASLAMAIGTLAMRRGEFAAARAAFQRQADLYRDEGLELGECMALTNLANVAFDLGDLDGAIAAVRRAIDGMERLRAPFGLPAARAFHAVVLAVRGDDVQILTLAREAYDQVTGAGAGAAVHVFMAAALHFARCGEAQRAALIGGHAWHAMTEGNRAPCPGERMMKERLITLTSPSVGAATIEDWLNAGGKLTQAQVAALAFEGRPLEDVAC